MPKPITLFVLDNFYLFNKATTIALYRDLKNKDIRDLFLLTALPLSVETINSSRELLRQFKKHGFTVHGIVTTGDLNLVYDKKPPNFVAPYNPNNLGQAFTHALSSLEINPVYFDSSQTQTSATQDLTELKADTNYHHDKELLFDFFLEHRPGWVSSIVIIDTTDELMQLIPRFKPNDYSLLLPPITLILPQKYQQNYEEEIEKHLQKDFIISITRAIDDHIKTLSPKHTKTRSALLRLQETLLTKELRNQKVADILNQWTTTLPSRIKARSFAFVEKLKTTVGHQGFRNFLTTLPTEILARIYQNINPIEVNTVTNRIDNASNALCKSPFYWHDKGRHHFFGSSQNQQPIRDARQFWEEDRRQHSQLNRREWQFLVLIKDSDLENLQKMEFSLDDLWQIEDEEGITALEWSWKNNDQKLLNFFYSRAIQAYSSSTGELDLLKTSEYGTILHWTIYCRQSEECLRELIKAGCKINVVSKLKGTPLYASVIMNYEKALVTLLSYRRTKLEEPARDGSTPLYLAAQEGKIKLVSHLLYKGANKEALYKEEGYTPLYVAAQNGHYDTVYRLLISGANIRIACTMGSTPLYIAAQQGRYRVVELLLSLGVNIEASFKGRFTALHVASHNGHVDCVRTLIRHGAFVNLISPDSSTPLYVAAENGHGDVVKNLLEAQADPEITFQDYTPLYVATKNGHKDVVEALIPFCSNELINRRFKGHTTLYIAAQNNNPEIIKLLIAHGASFNNEGQNYYFPLYIASQRGNAEIVRVLCNTPGIILDELTSRGASSVYIAAQKGHIKVMEILLKHSANLNQPYSNGAKPIHAAAKEGHVEIKGAEVSGYSFNSISEGFCLALLKIKKYIEKFNTPEHSDMLLAQALLKELIEQEDDSPDKIKEISEKYEITDDVFLKELSLYKNTSCPIR